MQSQRGLEDSSIQPKARLDEAQETFREWFEAHPQLRLLSIDLVEFNCGGLCLTVHAVMRRRAHLCACLREKGFIAKWRHFRSGAKCMNLLFGYSRPDKRYFVQVVGRAGTAKVFHRTQFEEALAAFCHYADDLFA